MKADIENFSDSLFKDCYTRINKYSDDIVVENNRKPDDGKIMILNLSCLVNREKITELGGELGAINNTDGVFVHFYGPWPPYSFVNNKDTLAIKEESHGTH